MLKIVKLQFNCIERVHLISLDEDFLPLTAAEAPLFAGVTAARSTFLEWAASQEGGKRDFREGTLERRLAASAMRGSMLEMAEMARSIEISGIDPGISERFRMPARRTYAALSASGTAFAEAAEPIKALFIARGLAATFVDDLLAHVAVFGTGSATRGDGLTRQTSSTAGLAIVAKQGMDFVRQLRPMVRARLKSQPALAAAWDLAARVESAGSPEEEEPAPAPPSGGSKRRGATNKRTSRGGGAIPPVAFFLASEWGARR
jgi:hypothetical protein